MEEEKPKPAPEHKALVTDRSHAHANANARVTWDEETIALHDLDRGTRMKIDEPNTPYHYYAESDEHGGVSPARSLSGREAQPPIQWDELQSKLQDVKDKKKSEWDSSDDESSSVSSASGGLSFAARDAEGIKLVKDPNFAQKRKQHYNEFERVRAWKMQHAAEGEDDEDEDEEEKKPALSQ
ncbi:hypothetical protein PHYSODRAFT_347553 [Phytophthora sojae]|uniref:Protein phosphatase inhibitor 2 n=1 Tax=Phytophthora sojae (strain P6497) TaxID=1094619 RepID=G5A1H1_PHYSP|nr:hypothetical protein PHYSODRAFT_347553 [Phytophthora sojae]EGZ10769.1 hypothetical protein PHYSODRAFT_347553 [Phytophthora sojae]|eukprot:XP_009533514.1 hypothetical protein PHYSODRAFT_347553 [Phytophthora sojae]